jgi:hypothetical protein
MGHATLDMLLKRYGCFTGQTRGEAILKFDQGYINGAQNIASLFSFFTTFCVTILATAFPVFPFFDLLA